MSFGPLHDSLDDAAHHLPFVLEHVLEHLVLLGIAQTLENDLLADLGRQASKVLGWQGDVDQVTQRRGPLLDGVLEADLHRRV